MTNLLLTGGILVSTTNYRHISFLLTLYQQIKINYNPGQWWWLTRSRNTVDNQLSTYLHVYSRRRLVAIITLRTHLLRAYLNRTDVGIGLVPARQELQLNPSQLGDNRAIFHLLQLREPAVWIDLLTHLMLFMYLTRNLTKHVTYQYPTIE